MTKQDYELIARVIRETREEASISPMSAEDAMDTLIAGMASALKSDNSRFVAERFAAACMGEDSHDSAGRKVRYSAR